MEAEIIKKYETNLDSKKRLTIRGGVFKHYVVEVYSNGKVVLNPRVLIDPNTISKNALNMIEKSMENLKNGNVSEPIDLNKYNFDEELD